MNRYQTSRNIFAHLCRSVTNSISDTLRKIFAETEASGAMREIMIRDPAFRIDSHELFMREVAIPTILDSLVTGDFATLKIWCSDSAFRGARAFIDARLLPGSRLDGLILDMRAVELASVRLLEDNSPAMVYTLTAQQVVPLRSLLDNTLLSPRDDTIEHVVYVMAFSIEHPSVHLPNRTKTRGWRLVEFAARERDAW
jgi:import inner membrane translocase subunit TIM44